MAEKTEAWRRYLPVLIVTAVIVPMAWMAGHRFLDVSLSSLFMKAPPEKKFMEAWATDIGHLDKIHALHPGFKDLKQIKISSPSEKLKVSFKKYPISFNVKPTGHYTLEIF